MTLIIRPRTDWQLPTQPVTGPAYPTSTIIDVVYHYPGSGPNANYSDPVKSLRNMQNAYLTDPNRGYSLGYNYCIDLIGIVWEVRGIDIRCAATKGYNDKGIAVQFLVPGVLPANEVQLSTAVNLHHWLEQHHSRQLGVAGHYQRGTTQTPCPGAGVKPQLPELERHIRAVAPPTPTPPVPAPKEDDVNYLYRHPISGSLYVIAGSCATKTYVDLWSYQRLWDTGKYLDAHNILSLEMIDRIPTI